MKNALFPGTFDLLHPGHLFSLDWASKKCDHLTAAVNINPITEPIESDLDRFVRLLSCKFVDDVLYYENLNELETICMSGHYSILFLDKEMKLTQIESFTTEKIYVPQLSNHSLEKIKSKLRS